MLYDALYTLEIALFHYLSLLDKVMGHMQLMHIPSERNMRTFLKTFLSLPFILITAQ